MTKDEALRLYRHMLLIRRFEERCAQLYVEGKIGGFLHLYIGQEAVGVGAMSLLRPDDYFITSYRDHGYALARGTDPRPLMAELCGKATGISRGKGGSMHFYDVPPGNFGGDGIVGGHLPVAAGMGYGIRLRGTDQVVLCFFGDGAVNEGAFHEALNVSALWDLPVVYIIENNRYGMGTSLDRASSVKDLYQRGSAYGMPRRDVNGMDLLAVRDVARRGDRPRAQGEAADPDRGRDLPLPRPLHVRPRQVPHQGRGRGDDACTTRSTSSASGSPSRSASRRPSWTRSTRTCWPRWRRRVTLHRGEPVPAAGVALRGRLRALALHQHEGGREGPRLARRQEGGPRARDLPPASGRAGQGGGAEPWPLMTMREALNQAMREEMRRDPSVFILGEEVGAYQGAYKITQGLLAEFGEWRVRDTPIAEEAIAGVAVGAAFIGLRPIAEMMTFNFSLLALDRSSTTRPSTATCRAGRSAARWSCAGPRARRPRWRRSTRRRSRAGSRTSPAWSW